VLLESGVHHETLDIERREVERALPDATVLEREVELVRRVGPFRRYMAALDRNPDRLESPGR